MNEAETTEQQTPSSSEFDELLLVIAVTVSGLAGCSERNCAYVCLRRSSRGSVANLATARTP